VLRDPTRGGLAATLNEIGEASGVGMRLEEAALPCGPGGARLRMLGLDPLHIANEGKLVAICPEEEAARGWPSCAPTAKACIGTVGTRAAPERRILP
jgi:hydrogenase expression/formation protein HypE